MTSIRNYSADIEQLEVTLAEADCVLIGAGAGLSTSAGFVYDGDRFTKSFSDFEQKYNFHDMYSGSYPAARYVDIPDRLCEAGRFGQKSGRGWYRYVDGKRTIDPAVTELIEASRAAKGLTPRAIDADEIVSRLLKAMADEGQALLAEGIAARASDIDLVMINGYGFPAYRGGPMFAAAAKSGTA